MAKISARGATELARVCLVQERPSAAEADVTRQIVTRLLRSDGVTLEKVQVEFLYPPYKHDWGWKRIAQLSDELRRQLRRNPGPVVAQWVKSHEENGFVRC